jgi:hypothetical protein
MRLSTGPLHVTAVTIAEHADAPRIQINLGSSLRLTLRPDEAIDVATQLVDAVEQLRNHQPNTGAPR